jgi:hypothetical protein
VKLKQSRMDELRGRFKWSSLASSMPPTARGKLKQLAWVIRGNTIPREDRVGGIDGAYLR